MKDSAGAQREAGAADADLERVQLAVADRWR